MDVETNIKGRMVLNRIFAGMALIGAMICMHYAYELSGWRSWAFSFAWGWLCSVTITRTLNASIYASGLLAGELITEIRKVNR